MARAATFANLLTCFTMMAFAGRKIPKLFFAFPELACSLVMQPYVFVSTVSISVPVLLRGTPPHSDGLNMLGRCLAVCGPALRDVLHDACPVTCPAGPCCDVMPPRHARGRIGRGRTQAQWGTVIAGGRTRAACERPGRKQSQKFRVPIRASCGAFASALAAAQTARCLPRADRRPLQKKLAVLRLEVGAEVLQHAQMDTHAGRQPFHPARRGLCATFQAQL